MPNYKLGDVLLMKFPFTNNQTFKKRPALVIKDTNDGDIIVCRIPSQLYYSLYDVELKDWRLCGLKLPSVIRIHKIASLEKNLVDLKLGEIDSLVKAKTVMVIGLLTQP